MSQWPNRRDIGRMWLAHGAAANLDIRQCAFWCRHFYFRAGFGEGGSLQPIKDHINCEEPVPGISNIPMLWGEHPMASDGNLGL
jgi:hypothetical protein